MGFNVMTSGSSGNPNREFTYDFLSGNKKQNIYLAVNKSGTDVRTTPAFSPAEIPNLISSGRANEMATPNINDLGLLIFQNVYINNYALDITVGNYPKVDVGFTADNVIFVGSGSGIKTPYINSQNAEVEYGDKEILIPKNYDRANSNFDVHHTFRPSDVVVAVSKRAAKEDVIFETNFESSEGGWRTYGTTPEGVLASTTSSQQYQGLKSLAVSSDGSLGSANYGGVTITASELQKMSAGEYYTIQYAIKVNTTDPNGKLIVFSHQNGQMDDSNLSHQNFYDDDWTVVTHRVKLDAVKSNMYFWAIDPNLTFWIDSFKIYKDAANEPILFYKDIFQSMKLSIPMNRENLSCIGYKYHVDRSLTLPLKSTLTIDMIESGANYQLSGNFLDNLRRDEDYDVSLTFMDGGGNQGMKYNIFGAKFNGAAYSSDIGSNKTISTTFTMSNDYDYARSVISAEGQGLFILDYLVDDNLNLLTTDGGDYFSDDIPHLF
jgi:hypothetical protein